MKGKFVFDKATGTMKPAEAAVEQAIKSDIKNEIITSKMDGTVEKPVFEEKAEIEPTTQSQSQRIMKLKRVDVPTSVQLVNSRGIPEGYLDSYGKGILMFHETDDYDICQIVDEKTGKPLAFIGGYALQFNFNMAELKSLERIEQCLEGITKLFRHKLMSQALGSNKSV